MNCVYSAGFPCYLLHHSAYELALCISEYKPAVEFLTVAGSKAIEVAGRSKFHEDNLIL